MSTILVLYQGAEPPNSLTNLKVAEGVERDVADLLGEFGAGVSANPNYSIIVQDGPARRYWYPNE